MFWTAFIEVLKIRLFVILVEHFVAHVCMASWLLLMVLCKVDTVVRRVQVAMKMFFILRDFEAIRMCYVLGSVSWRSW